MTIWNFATGWVPSWLLPLALFAAIAALGLAIHAAGLRWVNRQPLSWHPFLRHVCARTRRLIRFMILLFAAGMALPQIAIPGAAQGTVRSVFMALFIAQLGWIALVAANLAMDRYIGGLNLQAADNLMARKSATQMRIFRQAINVLLATLTIAFALMNFDSVRQFGVSLFASAGVAGIVAGLAARPMLENLISGYLYVLRKIDHARRMISVRSNLGIAPPFTEMVLFGVIGVVLRETL